MDLHSVAEVVFGHEGVEGGGVVQSFRLVQEGMASERVEVLVVTEVRQLGIGGGYVRGEEVMGAA
jgi:hypothetical protein